MTQSALRSRTILVAEDSEEQRTLYVEVLTQAGSCVRAFALCSRQ